MLQIPNLLKKVKWLFSEMTFYLFLGTVTYNAYFCQYGRKVVENKANNIKIMKYSIKMCSTMAGPISNIEIQV